MLLNHAYCFQNICVSLSKHKKNRPVVSVGVIAFPFLLVTGDINLVMFYFVSGSAGQMLSPAHLCLLVTLDYFKADFLKTLRPIAFLEVILVAAAYVMVALT